MIKVGYSRSDTSRLTTTWSVACKQIHRSDSSSRSNLSIRRIPWMIHVKQNQQYSGNSTGKGKIGSLWSSDNRVKKISGKLTYWSKPLLTTREETLDCGRSSSKMKQVVRLREVLYSCQSTVEDLFSYCSELCVTLSEVLARIMGRAPNSASLVE